MLRRLLAYSLALFLIVAPPISAQEESTLLDTIIERAYAYADDDEYEAALALIEIALEETTDNPVLIAHRAVCLSEVGAYEDALEEAERAHKMDDGLGTHKALAWVLYEMNDYQRAEIYFDKVLDVEPDNIEFVGLAGIADYKLGNIERAEVRLKHAIELEPAEFLWYWWLADLYWKLDRPRDAEPFFDDAVVRDSTYRLLFKHRADLRLELGDFDGAYEDYNAAIDLDEDYEEAWESMIELQWERANFFGYLRDIDRYEEARTGQEGYAEFWGMFIVGSVVALVIVCSGMILSIAGLLIWHQRRMKSIQTPEPPPMRS